jgi:hypothetical protein
MPHHTVLLTAAKKIASSEEELLGLAQRNWIHPTVIGDVTYISGRDEYKARFILHLRHKLKLSDEEIQRVLDEQAPPYSLKDVPAVLGHPPGRGKKQEGAEGGRSARD